MRNANLDVQVLQFVNLQDPSSPNLSQVRQFVHVEVLGSVDFEAAL